LQLWTRPTDTADIARFWRREGRRRSRWTAARSRPHRRSVCRRPIVNSATRRRRTFLSLEVARRWQRLSLPNCPRLGSCGPIRSRRYMGSRGSTSPTLARAETVHRFASPRQSWCCTRWRSWRLGSLSGGEFQPATQVLRGKRPGRPGRSSFTRCASTSRARWNTRATLRCSDPIWRRHRCRAG